MRDSWSLEQCVRSILQMLSVRMTVVTSDCQSPCTEKNASQEDGETFSWKVSVPSLTLCHAQAAPQRHMIDFLAG